jgi:hypothetical protein
VDLESHWSMPERPYVAYHPNEQIYERNFMDMLNKYPVPDDYLKDADISASEPEVKEF